ncbi:MAG TPA: C4-dicarboxylic acid transporter DauA [Thermoanaerobaculia bacterium]|nr:C4-dicarboxylic acid transporter DauA [Thermoanaerobaculia bacterium]
MAQPSSTADAVGVPAPTAPPPLRRWLRALPIGMALRQSLAEGYSLARLRADLLAGLVVGVVAVPLSMALAIAAGVPPQHGLYTAIVAGGVIALCGGSRMQVSGPTAAFVVILAPISAQHGLGGLALATGMAGVLLLAMGLGKLGRLIEFVPYPVTTGFTAGIAIVIATLQVKDFLGLQTGALPGHFLPRALALVRALPSFRSGDLLVGAFTLALLIVWPRLVKAVPAPLVALALGSLLAWGVGRAAPQLAAATIQDRFHFTLGGILHGGIPPLPPQPVLPWRLPGPGGAPLTLSFELLQSLVPAAFAIAMLGAIESLLSAVVADGLAGTKHDPDGELVGQGIGNLVAPFFGGIAATGAIARTATNIRSGARTPIASFLHALFILAVMLALAPLLGYLPMASLAALLLTVAWRMSEYRHVVRVTRRAPRSDVAVLWVCLLLTVVFDMVIAVSVGIVLAALLFMRRMAEVSEVRSLTEEHHHASGPLPKGLILYEVAGPLFFGAAQRAISTLERAGQSARALVLDLEGVPVLDATALVNLESAIERLLARGTFVALGGVQKQPLRVLLQGGLRNRAGQLVIRRSLDKAIADAKATLGGGTIAG